MINSQEREKRTSCYYLWAIMIYLKHVAALSIQIVTLPQFKTNSFKIL